ncbi:MAG: GIY-YIG nuclease family protein [Candidatus Gastranaerophilales bacterium]|nr:GIY-YIG nuclease family protein [Candidatus Gastranaerophilales bacterium]
MDSNDLLSLIGDDDIFGINDQKPKPTPKNAEEERLVETFEEINEFFAKHDRAPQESSDIMEKKLYFRLKKFNENKEKITTLKPYDTYNLLKEEAKKIETIDDILSDSDLDLFNDEAEDIFNVRPVLAKATEILMPDYRGQHKPCKDFSIFEKHFVDCQKDIKEGRRTLSPFEKEQYIDEGMFFVLKGVLVYVAEVGEDEIVNGKKRARLRLIYENGKESDILNRSLARELYRDGKRVSQNMDKVMDKFSGITDEDEDTGYIYVLESLSDNPNIQAINNLYKIGFSTTPVLERIKNAKKEPTYLMADVKVTAEYKCLNLNPQKFEQLLHRFFGHCCVSIDVFDNQGQRHTPREWFSIPIDVIQQAINLIISGDIVHYTYDRSKKELVRK